MFDYFKSDIEITAQNNNEAKEIIEEAQKILSFFEAKYGKENQRYKKIFNEYKQLDKVYKDAITIEKNITKEELKLIEKEFDDLTDIETYSEKIERLKSDIKKEVKDKLADVIENINDNMSNEDIIGNLDTLEYIATGELDTKIKKLKTRFKKEGKTDFLMIEFSNIIGEISPVSVSNLPGHNKVQEKYLSKIFGGENRYNNEYIVGYNNKIGNYLIKKDDFESKIKKENIKEINSTEIGNYFDYLGSKGDLTIGTLLDNFGENNLYSLREIWLNPKESDTKIAKKKLKGLKIGNNTGKDLIEIIKMFSGVNDFLEISSSIGKDKNKAEMALKLLDKNLNGIKDKFRNDLIDKFKKNNPGKEKDAEKIIDEMLKELMKNKSIGGLPNVYKIFNDYNQKYKLGLKIKEETRKLIEIQQQKTTKEIIEGKLEEQKAKDSGDPIRVKEIQERNEKLEGILLESQASLKINQLSSEKDIISIAKGEIIFENYINELKKKDESLKLLVDKIETNNKKQIDNNKKNNNEIKSDISLLDNKINKQYNPENGSVKIGKKEIKLSSQENELVKNNPETVKNIVDFYSILNKIGLAKLWPIKEQIFNVIGSIKGVGFKIDQNYLSENETKMFLNAILKSTGENVIDPILGIKDFISTIERKNNTQYSGNEAQINKAGETKIEQKFISSYAPKGNILGFNSPAFEEKIRS